MVKKKYSPEKIKKNTWKNSINRSRKTKLKTSPQANFDTRYYKDYATIKITKEYQTHIMGQLSEQKNFTITKKTSPDKNKKNILKNKYKNILKNYKVHQQK